MTLYEECLVVLGNNTETMSKKETEGIFKEISRLFPMTPWGRIDWEKVSRKIRLDSTQEVINKFKEEKLIYEDVYILWDEVSLPAIKTQIQTVANAIYDVTAVSFDTWILCPLNKCLIEFYHENEIILGYW